MLITCNTWVCIPKVVNAGKIKYIFHPNMGWNDNNVERLLSAHVYALTDTQGAVDCRVVHV
jgi:hypothetical protein